MRGFVEMDDFKNRTKGPWVFNKTTRHITVPSSGNNKYVCDCDDTVEGIANCEFVVHMENNFDRLTTELAQCREALEEMLEEKVDYMRINKLGNPETQHSVKRARAALANKVQS